MGQVITWSEYCKYSMNLVNGGSVFPVALPEWSFDETSRTKDAYFVKESTSWKLINMECFLFVMLRLILNQPN